MPMVLSDVQRVVDFMRTQGVASFKLDDLEVTFSSTTAGALETERMDAPAVKPEAEPVAEPISSAAIEEDQRRQDEALLYYSSG